MIRINVFEVCWSWYGAGNRKRNRVAGAARARGSSVLEWRRPRATRASSHATRDCDIIFGKTAVDRIYKIFHENPVKSCKSCTTITMTSRSDRGPQDLIYGPNAVLEALRAGRRQIETITILESARPDRLKSLLDLARE